MRKNLPAFSRRLFIFTVLTAAFGTLAAAQGAPFPGDLPGTAGVPGTGGERALAAEIIWYRSNASGMALEIVPSPLAALRNEYCVSVESKELGELPVVLSPYSQGTYRIELRTLYEKGKEFRRQWIMRDDKNIVRVSASGGSGFFSVREDTAGESSGDNSPAAEAEKQSGFIEIMNNEGVLERELRYEEDFSEWEYRFHYNGNILVRAETLFKEAPGAENGEDKGDGPDMGVADGTGEYSGENAGLQSPGAEKNAEGFVLLTTDYYRYTRSFSLRAIDRVVHGVMGSRIAFPRLGPDVPYEGGVSFRGVNYTSSFLSGLNSPEGATISYTLDSRGRVLTETWKDAEGVITGELLNTWSSDRLQSVLWKSPGEERLVEYDYSSDGSRIAERNYRQGELERSVTARDGIDTEEIFLNGRLVLRAFWENGLKISEERIMGAGRNSAAQAGTGPAGAGSANAAPAGEAGP